MLSGTQGLVYPTAATNLSHTDLIRLLKIEIRNRIDYSASYKPALYRYLGGVGRQKTINTSAVLITVYSALHVPARVVSKQVHGVHMLSPVAGNEGD